MNEIEIIRRRSLTENVTLEDVKGGSKSGSGLCCLSNDACNKNNDNPTTPIKDQPTNPGQELD